MQHFNFKSMLLSEPAAPAFVFVRLLTQTVIHMKQIRTDVVPLQQPMTQHHGIYAAAEAENCF